LPPPPSPFFATERGARPPHSSLDLLLATEFRWAGVLKKSPFPYSPLQVFSAPHVFDFCHPPPGPFFISVFRSPLCPVCRSPPLRPTRKCRLFCHLSFFFPFPTEPVHPFFCPFPFLFCPCSFGRCVVMHSPPYLSWYGGLVLLSFVAEIFFFFPVHVSFSLPPVLFFSHTCVSPCAPLIFHS